MRKDMAVVLLSAWFLSVSEPGVCETAQTTPPSQDSLQASQLNDIYQQLGRIDARLTNVHDQTSSAQQEAREAFLEARNLEKYLWVITFLLAVFFLGVVAYIKTSLSRHARVLSDKLSREVSGRLVKESEAQFSKFADVLSSEAQTAVRSIEDKHFHYMQITSLRFSKQYDDALKLIDWAGDYRAHRDLPQAVQRSLIACVCRSSKARQNKEHLKAWQWVRDLVDTDKNVDNIIAMIKTGNTLKQWDTVIEIYERLSNGLTEAEKNRCEPYLFVSYRRSSDPEMKEHNARRVKRIAEKHQETKDIKFKTTLAAFYRDEGRFQDAEMVMSPDVRQFTGSSVLIEGWDKLFNTYLANAIDQGKPESAIAQVRTMLAQALSPDHIFNCARLAWRLPDTNPDREDIFRLIRSRFENGFMPEKDDGTVKTAAILEEISGNRTQAEKLLLDSIDDLAKDSGSWSSYQVYYYKCMLAELYQSRQAKAELSKSIDLLEAMVANDNIGEATYLLAKAYALGGEHSLMNRYLDAAGGIKRKWIMKTKADPAFSDAKGVEELLSRYATRV